MSLTMIFITLGGIVFVFCILFVWAMCTAARQADDEEIKEVIYEKGN